MKKIFGISLFASSAVILSSCATEQSTTDIINSYANYQYDVTDYVPASIKNEVNDVSSETANQSFISMMTSASSTPEVIYGTLNKEDLTTEKSDAISKLLYGAADIQSQYDDFTQYVDNVKQYLSEDNDTVSGDWGSVKMTEIEDGLNFTFSDISFGVFSMEISLDYTGSGDDTSFDGTITGSTNGGTNYLVNFGFDRETTYSYSFFKFSNAEIYFAREYSIAENGNYMTEAYYNTGLTTAAADDVSYTLGAFGDSESVGVSADVKFSTLRVQADEVYNNNAELVFKNYGTVIGDTPVKEASYNLKFVNGWKSIDTGLSNTTDQSVVDNDDHASHKNDTASLTYDDDSNGNIKIERTKTYDAAKDLTDDNNFNPTADRKILMIRKGSLGNELTKSNIGFNFDKLTFDYDADYLFNAYEKGINAYETGKINNISLSALTLSDFKDLVGKE